LTWRAPSSPRHACGLNVSFFLHPCTQSKPAQPGAVCVNVGRNKPANPCEGGAILRGGSGKGLVFEKGGRGALRGPCLLDLSPNFGGLVMVRSKVSNSQGTDL
jgi:hypothetical protein